MNSRSLALVSSLLGMAALGVAAEIPPLPLLPLDQLPAGVRDRVATAMRRASEQPARAEAAGELGMLLHAHDQVSSAIAAYERARALAPAAFEWSYLSGLLQLRAGRAADAVPRLRVAVAQQPRGLAARVRLGEALLASGETEQARVLYRAVLLEHPDVPQAHYGFGRATAAGGDPAAAADSYRAATRLFPGYAAAHYALGLISRDLGRLDEAHLHLGAYQRHVMDAPPLEDPLLERVLALKRGSDEVLAEGVRLGAIGDLAGAIREHERALELDRSLTRAHANLIAFYGRAGRWEKVDEHYRAAVALAPSLPEIHYNYGIALQQQGRRAEAAEALQRVLAASPLHAPAHNSLGLLLESDGKLDQAAAHYRQAVANQAAYRAARFNLGRVLVALRRPREAVAQLEQILDPDDEETPRYVYALGVAYARAGERDRAIQSLQEARRKAQARGQAELGAAIEDDLRRLEGSPVR